MQSISTPIQAPEQSSPQLGSVSQAESGLVTLLFCGMVALLCAWVLSLPLFPMQDGPMHLYFATVLGDLLHHRASSVFAHGYAVQHLLPPYSVHYYLLILLLGILPAVWAEKVVVCLIVGCFSFGCRFLSRANGPGGTVLAFFALPLALNWPLVMGFQNYVLSLAFACWALGLWSRLAHCSSLSLRALFVGLCALVAITHPVPLVLVLGFCVVDISLRAAMQKRTATSGMFPQFWPRDAVALLAASTLLLYLRAFTDKHRSAEDFRATESVMTRVRYFYGLHGLDFFTRTTLGARLQQISLYLLLAVCLVLAARAWRSRSSWTSAQTWLVATVLFTLALPLLPDDLSGSKALVSRLQIVTFIGLIAAASGVPQLGIVWRRSIVGLALASTLGTVALCQVRLAPIAKRIAAMDREPLPNEIHPGASGLMLPAHVTDESAFETVSYEPLHWQAARVFLRTQTILLNPPWMDSTWLPLIAQPALLTGKFTPWTLECYKCLREKLVESATTRAEVLSTTDFIVFVDQPGTATRATMSDVLDAALPDGRRYPWACNAHDWYWVCRKIGPAT